jgi:hypothetical protein
VGQSAPLSPKYKARKHEIFLGETSSTATNKPLDLKSTLVEFLAGGSFLPTFDFTLCKKEKKKRIFVHKIFVESQGMSFPKWVNGAHFRMS